MPDQPQKSAVNLSCSCPNPTPVQSSKETLHPGEDTVSCSRCRLPLSHNASQAYWFGWHHAKAEDRNMIERSAERSPLVAPHPTHQDDKGTVHQGTRRAVRKPKRG